MMGDSESTECKPLYTRGTYTRLADQTRRRYDHPMIRTFADKEAEGLFHGRLARKLPSGIQRAAQRKLRQLHAAEALTDLRVPPGNHLEALKGDRAGQHSIRINDQWRICFIWSDGGADDVEIADYH